jgi:glycerol-3-phosphate acyltransferase PlsX
MVADIGNKLVRVAIDAMGGDYAPQEIVKGAMEAVKEGGVEIILVGQEDIIQKEMERYDVSGLPIRVRNASEVILDGEPPIMALRQKPDASVLVATQLVKTDEADAVISMGPTGTVMVSAMMDLGMLEGIKRPTVGGVVFGFAPNTVVFDMGANVDCNPRELLNFAVIGCVVARRMLHITNPTVALLSNGAEEGKGNQSVKRAYQLFKNSNLNFIGSVEGNDIAAGRANVIICDGFTGNVLIKFCEGLSWSIIERLRITLDKRLSKIDIEAVCGDLFSLTNAADVMGGGLIFGINGVVWIGHGRAKAPQVAKSIHQVKLAVEANLVEELRTELKKIRNEG